MGPSLRWGDGLFCLFSVLMTTRPLRDERHQLPEI